MHDTEYDILAESTLRDAVQHMKKNLAGAKTIDDLVPIREALGKIYSACDKKVELSLPPDIPPDAKIKVHVDHKRLMSREIRDGLLNTIDQYVSAECVSDENMKQAVRAVDALLAELASTVTTEPDGTHRITVNRPEFPGGSKN